MKKLTGVSLVIVGAIILCYIGFYNGFPLIYFDTTDYLGGAFGRYIPIDRPVFYGLFMRFASLQNTLWLVILIQGLLLSYLLFETFGIFYTGHKRNLYFILSIAILTACTGISQNTSMLLPDIFSSISILCLINILLNNNLTNTRRAILSFIFVLCLLIHLSNLLVLLSLLLLMVVYLIVKQLKKQAVSIKKNRLFLSFILVISIFIIAPTLNYLWGKKFIITQASHVFIMAHLVETGILEEYLNDQCTKKNYKICEYKNSLDTNFIWQPNGTFGKLGGWEGTRTEFNQIIKDIITTPKYELLLLKRSVEYSFQQFFTFRIPHNTSLEIQPFLKADYKMYGRDYGASLQYNNKLNYDITNQIQQILVLVSLAFLCFVLVSPAYFNSLSPKLKWFLILILAFCILNAAICANFATIHNRYQNRIIWLIPLTAFFVLEFLWVSRSKKEKF
jgi:hypothetical protein